MDEVLAAKIGSMCILGFCSLFFGLLPIKLVQKFNLLEDKKTKGNSKSKLALTALNCFGAGVILTTCFTHMVPDVNGILNEQYQSGKLQEPA